MNKLGKKHIYISAILGLVLLLGFLGLFFTRDERHFKRFTNQLFIGELQNDTLSMHYTVANPDNYGIDYTPGLPLYSTDAYTLPVVLENYVQGLNSLNTHWMSDDSIVCKDVLTDYLTLSLDRAKYPYYAEPFSPSSGMLTQLPVLLGEYTFRSKDDIVDYFKIIESTPDYFDSIMDYETQKAHEGLFMADFSVDKLLDQCDVIANKDAMKEKTHFLYTTFASRLDTLHKNGIITEKEKESYLIKNQRIINTVLFPAYEKTGDRLLLLKGSGTNTQGLYYLPQGKEYYTALLLGSTGSGKSIPDLKETLQKQLTNDLQALTDLMEDRTSLFQQERFPIASPSEMLLQLRSASEKDFPAITLDSFSIKNVDSAMEDFLSPAFYLTPPIDDMGENTIYINQASHPSGVELYTTLAHEGFPGHLLQTVYFQSHYPKEYLPVRSLLYFGGYVEGYATYVEMLSYEYAKNLVSDLETKDTYEAIRLDRSIQLCLYSLLDILIHYDGITFKEAYAVLSEFGISNEEIAKDLYEYIVEEPANYPKYYIGYLEILELKANAKKLWGEDYSDLRFHTFYLDMGPCTFPYLNERLKSDNT